MRTLFGIQNHTMTMFSKIIACNVQNCHTLKKGVYEYWGKGESLLFEMTAKCFVDKSS